MWVPSDHDRPAGLHKLLQPMLQALHLSWAQQLDRDRLLRTDSIPGVRPIPGLYVACYNSPRWVLRRCELAARRGRPRSADLAAIRRQGRSGEKRRLVC